MKFQITRTSHGWSQHEPPCLHPTLKDETPEEDRVGDSAEDYRHVWTVEVSDLAELMTLTSSTSNTRKWLSRNHSWPARAIIGSVDTGDGTLPTIEIYDAFRE